MIAVATTMPRARTSGAPLSRPGFKRSDNRDQRHCQLIAHPYMLADAPDVPYAVTAYATGSLTSGRMAPVKADASGVNASVLQGLSGVVLVERTF